MAVSATAAARDAGTTPPPPHSHTPALPYVLMTGPMLFHSGTLSTWAPEMSRFAQHAYVEVAEEDAEALGIADGALVRLAGERGEAILHAHVQPEGTPGILFVPLHFAEPAVNRLLDAGCAVDRVKLELV